VTLLENGTHVLFGARLGRYTEGHRQLDGDEIAKGVKG
jgi:hypothetical protein